MNCRLDNVATITGKDGKLSVLAQVLLFFFLLFL